MFSKWRKPKAPPFKVGDKVILNGNWKSIKKNKSYLCIECQEPYNIYKIHTIKNIRNDKIYLDLPNGHELCANDPVFFHITIPLTDQECIDLIYQKFTESLLKRR